MKCVLATQQNVENTRRNLKRKKSPENILTLQIICNQTMQCEDSLLPGTLKIVNVNSDSSS